MSDNIQPDGSWRDPNAQMAMDIGLGKVNPNAAGYAAVQAAHQMYGSAHVNGLWGHHANAPAPSGGGSSWFSGGASAGGWAPAARRSAFGGVTAPRPAALSADERRRAARTDHPPMSAEAVRALLGLPPLTDTDRAAIAARRAAESAAAASPPRRPRLLRRALLWAVPVALVGVALWQPVATTTVVGAVAPELRYAVLQRIDPVRFPSFAGRLQVDAASPGTAFVVRGAQGAAIHLQVRLPLGTEVVATDGRAAPGQAVRGRPVVVAGVRWILAPMLRDGQRVGTALFGVQDLQAVAARPIAARR